MVSYRDTDGVVIATRRQLDVAPTMIERVDHEVHQRLLQANPVGADHQPDGGLCEDPPLAEGGAHPLLVGDLLEEVAYVERLDMDREPALIGLGQHEELLGETYQTVGLLPR